MVDVRKAATDDLERLSDAFASAFSQDPIFLWMLAGKSGTERRLHRFFRTLLAEEFRHGDHEVFLASDGSGGAVWKGLDKWKTPTSTLIRQAPNLTRAFGLGNFRPLKVIGAMEKIHPTEPHYYLEVLGTEQAAEGKGIGSAVITEVLERCDREGLPAYLESSNPRNIPFYARHGFEVRDVVPLPEGAPPLTPMWREPRT